MNTYPSSTRFFNQNNQLLTVKDGAKSRTALRSAGLPLPERHGEIGAAAALLLASDTKALQSMRKTIQSVKRTRTRG